MPESLWQALTSAFWRYVLPLTAVIGVTLFALWAVNTAVAEIDKRILKPSLDEDRRERLLTLVKAIKYTLRALIITVGVLVGLGTIGIDIGPALAAVGVLGLAVSLGAQTLIKDIIGGLTVLLEDEYRIGDSVKIGSVSGDVERISLRRTDVRDAEGRLHMIPNGDVRVVANESRDFAYALVELNFGFDDDIDRVVRVLDDALERFSEDQRIKRHLLAPPEIFGWNAFSEWAVSVRLRAKVVAGNQGEVARILRKHALDALVAAGIPVEIPPNGVGSKV